MAKLNTVHATVLPSDVKAKLLETQSLLNKHNILVRHEPRPVAVYFQNIRRGPLGAVRAALRRSVPSWAVLGL